MRSFDQLQRAANKIERGTRARLSNAEVESLHDHWIRALEANMDRRDISVGVYIRYREQANRLLKSKFRQAASQPSNPETGETNAPPIVGK